MPQKNKEDRTNYMREWYQRNKEKQAAYQKMYAKKNRAALADYKAARGCSHCGETDPRVLQFHHVSGDKEFTIGTKPQSKGIATLLLEAEKCEILCANCHIKEHSND